MAETKPASVFTISIKRPDGFDVKLAPGGQGERDLIEAVVEEMIKRKYGEWQSPVGLRTEAHVVAVVRSAMELVLLRLKSEVLPR